MKYSESRGAWVYDWKQIISDLQNDRYTHSGKVDVRFAADNWRTCPVGNLPVAIPRCATSEAPLDPELAILGCSFTRQIRTMVRYPCSMVAAALRGTLRDIQRRAEVLLRRKI